MALVAAILGYLSITHSLANVLVESDPARAHLLDTENGPITAALAQKLFAEQPTPDRSAPFVRLAQAALRQDPTAVSAVATLGLQTGLRGDVVHTRRLFDYAQRLSRRDIRTQLWAIEDAVARDDIPAALHHYDIALRTIPMASDLLFPILAGALDQSAIRTNIVLTLRQQPTPQWGPKFISYLAATGGEPHALAQFFEEMHQAGMPLPTGAVATAVNGLSGSDAVEDAWHFYEKVRHGANRKISRDPYFAARLATPSLFDWVPVNDGKIATSLENGAFDFSVPTASGGILLQQMQVLPPGVYRFEGHGSGIMQGKDSLPYWVLSCHDGHELGRVIVANSTKAGSAFAGQFNVPRDCPVQTLSLFARPSDAVSGVSGQIDRAQLKPVGL
ncbi:hypothetical protein SIL82_20385 [Sphingomonas echinoides]|uniref:Uncharacterized protein n=1 Tax=Sphingomonas echinoides TaxID=59803 RepID=A0ABU4PT94_9SPHN|nr:hypothetical protein [Sphingomonas echinoides]MDX5986619.1 hypothetical protein [Sphingomonas echinoides]